MSGTGDTYRTADGSTNARAAKGRLYNVSALEDKLALSVACAHVGARRLCDLSSCTHVLDPAKLMRLFFCCVLQPS